MRKKIILLILLILTLLTGLLVYLNNVFLPVTLKEIIVREASKKLNRKVTIGSLYYAPFQGLVFRRVVIQEKAPQAGNMLTADEISVSILYLPLLTQKKVIIPSIVVDSPVVVLSRESADTWNFTDLLALSQDKADTAQQPFAVYLTGLTVTNGKIIFYDKSFTRDPLETLENIHIRASLALPDSIKATVKIFPKKQGALKVFADLNFRFLTKDFLCQLRAENVNLEKWAPFFNKPNFALQAANLSVGSIDLSRREGKISGKGELFFDQVKMLIQEKTAVRFFPTLKLNEIAILGQELRLKGILDIKQGEVLVDKNNKISSDMTYDFLFSKNGDKLSTEGTLAAPNLNVQGETPINLLTKAQGKIAFVLDANHMQSQSQLTFQNANLTLPPNVQITASPSVDFSLNYPFGQADAPLPSYTASITVVDAKAVNLPFVQTADNVSGKISLGPDKIAADSLTAVVNQTPLSLSGFVKNFKEPFAQIDLNVNNLDLGAWQGLVNQYMPEYGVSAKGIAAIKLKYKGDIKRVAGSSIDCTASLKDVAFKTKSMKDGVYGLSGDIHYVVERLNMSHFLPDQGFWKDLQFTFQEKPYLLNGALQFNNLVTSLKRGDLAIDLTSKIFPERLTILSCEGRYHQSKANVEGEIFFPKEKQGPRFNIKMRGGLWLEDLADLFPDLKEKLSPMAPQGLCLFDGLFAGDPSQWRDWALVLNLTSDEVSFYNYKFNKFSLKYAQRDRFINECTLGSSFYGGTLSLLGSSDLSIDEMPYKVSADIKNVDLALLKQDTPIKDKDLSGLASISYTGTGPLAHARLSQGQGFFSVNNGKLWQFDVLKGLGQLLFVPEKQNITLDSAQGDFSVVNEKVALKDAIIKGNQVELTCNGSIGFQGDLDFDIVSRFDEGVIKSSVSLQKTIAAFLTQADDFLMVKITGTIKEPKYKVSSRPLNVFQKTKDLLLDAIPNIFQ